MRVTLMGKNFMHEIILPQVAVGNYWLSDRTGEKEKKLVNIEAKDGKWQVVSDNRVKIIGQDYIGVNNNRVEISRNDDFFDILVDKIVLQEYEMYGLYIGNTDEIFILYCSPVYENSFLHLDIKSCSDILIGKSKGNHVMYNNPFISNKHAHIFLSNGRWKIENIETAYGTYVNGVPIQDRDVMLFNGDIIFIMGLRIIIMGNSIFINNPNGKLKYNANYFEENNQNFELKYELEKNEEEIELYSVDDYYSRAPRITNKIEHEKVKIDPPPKIQDKEQMPLALVLGSTLTMGAVTVISMINNIGNGRASGLSIFVAFAMLVGMVLIPIFNVKYERNRKVRYEEKRQKRYQDYIDSKLKVINGIKSKQRNILMENYLSAEECTKIIMQRSGRLWERKIEDYDFLSVRLGIGDIPLDIDIQYPEEQFAMEDDNLVEMLNDMATEAKTLKSAPIILSLAEKNVSAIISRENYNLDKIIKSIMIQLITFHSYEDLKLVFLLKKDNIKNWEYVKMLPHVWDNMKQIRFFATEYEDMIVISRYLEEELKDRLRT